MTTLLVSICLSQAEQPVAPIPRLKPAPNTSAWTIEYRYLTADPYPKQSDERLERLYAKLRQAQPRLKSVQVSKNVGHRREVYEFGDGSGTSEWIIGNFLLIEMRISGTLVIHSASDPNAPKFVADFSSLDWINHADYEGQADFQGIHCDIYKLPASDGVSEQTAYIDAKTGLPIAVETPGTTAVYKFKPSSESIDLPPELDKRLRAFQKEIVGSLH